MNIRQFVYFKQIIADQTLTKAAESLFISQQALSSSIVSLEEELGVKLFDRTSRGMKLTREGQYFLGQVDQILEILEETEHYFKTQKEDLHIKLALALGIISYVKDFFRKEQSQKHMELAITEYPDFLCEEQVIEGKAELGFALGPISNRYLDKNFLFGFRLCLVVPQGHPFYDRDKVGVEEFEGQDFILMNENFKSHHTFIKACKEAEVEPNIVYQSSEISTIHSLIADGLGIGITTNKIDPSLVSENSKLVEIDSDLFDWDVFLISKKGLDLSFAARQFQKDTLDYFVKDRTL